jgi:cobalt-zinc-cadmium efflux system outer membrane protein
MPATWPSVGRRRPGALEADVLRRFKAGDLARIDANLAQGERLAAEAEAIEAEAALLQAEQTYRNLTGAAAPSVLAAEAAVAAREPVEHHPQLAAVAAAARTARAKLRVAEETRRDAPEFAVRVVRERGEFSEPYANTVGVKLTIPFSSGARVRQENAAARAEASRPMPNWRWPNSGCSSTRRRPASTSPPPSASFAMARARRELAADNLRLAEKAFSLGESDLTTLLRVRAGAFEAEAFLNRQQVARAAAQSRLKQVLGVLP